MKNFKMQEEDLIASFRPDTTSNPALQPRQPYPHPVQPHLYHPNPSQHQHQVHVTPHSTIAVHNNPHLQPQQMHHPQNSRNVNTPVVFSIQQPLPQQNNGINSINTGSREQSQKGQIIQAVNAPSIQVAAPQAVNNNPQSNISMQKQPVVVSQNQNRTVSNQPPPQNVVYQNIQQTHVSHPIQGHPPPQPQSRSYSQQPIAQNMPNPHQNHPHQYPQHNHSQQSGHQQQIYHPETSIQKVNPVQQQPYPKQQQVHHPQHQEVQHQQQNHPQNPQQVVYPNSQQRRVQPNQAQVSQRSGEQQYNPQGIEQQYQQFDFNQLPPEERHRIWLQQQQQQQMAMQQQFEQGQYEYAPGEEGNQEYPPEYYQQGYEQITPELIQNLQGQATLWRQRFFYLYQRYQTFYDKFEVMHKQSAFLVDQFLTVDSEEEWLALKQKYDSLTERMGQVKEENTLILQQIQQNVQQNQKVQNQAINEEASRVWEHRYQELLEQYQSLSHHYAQLQSSSMAHNDMDQNQRVSMMNQKYNRLEAQYNHVVQELQNSEGAIKTRQEHEELLKYTQQLQAYIEQLETDNNNLVRGMKTSVDGSKTLPEPQLGQKIIQKDNQIKNLSQIVVNLQQKLKQTENRPKSSIGKDVHTSQLQNQIHQMGLYVNQLEQKLSMKEYQINGLKDKIQYLQEELHHKNEEIFNHNKYLQEKLNKIEIDLSNKKEHSTPPNQPSSLTSFNLEQDYQNRLRQYQRVIQSKNNQIRMLQQRISQSESETRKMSLQKSKILKDWQQRVDLIEEDQRKKLIQKDNSIRKMQFQIKQKSMDMQKKIQDKQNAIKILETQIQGLKEEIDSRIGEKDSIIKNLRDTNNRIGGELRDKITIISRINSPSLTPHLRSPSQSYVGQGFRHDQEVRMLTEQAERRIEEVNRLKKQRQTRNKQFRDLQMEYQTLQQQSNKRRIEVNNLKRQLSSIQNLQLQTQNLRSTISKKNKEISDLKNTLYELDRIKMDLETSRKQIDKQTQISKIKNKQIQQLTDRNYQLQEKIRQKDFKIAQKVQPITQRGNNDDQFFLQEELRRKQVEISRLKVQSEELQRTLKRQSDQLQSFKIKYPSKLKAAEEELFDVKLKLTTLQKKHSVADNRVKQLEETLRRVKASAVQEQNAESQRVKDHFTKLVQRLEDENRNIKEKVRVYEMKVNELELENNSLAGNNKELQMFKDENVKKLILLTEKLSQREEELKRVRDKGTHEVLNFRKKQSKTIELEAALKSRNDQARQLQKQKQSLRIQLRNLKKEFEDYKHHMFEKMEESTHKQMQNLNKQLNQYEAKFGFHNHNFDFKVKDKDANHVFERTVIYQLKQQIDFLRRQLQGKGSNISIDKLKINQIQQQTLMKSKQFNRSEKHHSQDQIDFYRQKNKQLQERVNSHIAVNKNLKDRIQQLAQQSHRPQQAQPIKQKYVQLQSAYRSLDQKCQLLFQENTYLKSEIGNKTPQEADQFDKQLHIEGLQLKLSQVTLQRNSFAEELRHVQMDKNELYAKCHELETILTKSENKITILQSQIQRLKDSSRSSKPVSNQNNLKIQIEELRIQNLQKDKQVTQERTKSSHFQTEYHQLQKYIKDLQVQINYLKQQQQQQSQNQINQNAQTEKWKTAFRSLQGSVQMLNSKISQLQGESEYYKLQAQKSSGTPEDVFYFLQLLRSNYMQLQSLSSEMRIQNEEDASLGQRMLQNSRRGLQSCQYIHQLLSS